MSTEKTHLVWLRVQVKFSSGIIQFQSSCRSGYGRPSPQTHASYRVCRLLKKKLSVFAIKTGIGRPPMWSARRAGYASLKRPFPCVPPCAPRFAYQHWSGIQAAVSKTVSTQTIQSHVRIPGWAAWRSAQPAKEQPQGHFVHGMTEELNCVCFGKLYEASDLPASLIGPAHSGKLPKRNPGVTPTQKRKRPA